MGPRYLITGLPRIRSAWLAAVMSTAGVPCYHDPTSHKYFTWAPSIGVSDPCAACQYPENAWDMYKEHPVVIVERHPAESRASFERWSGINLSHEVWGSILEHYNLFQSLAVGPNVIRVAYEDLNNELMVGAIYKHLLGVPMPGWVYPAFSRLDVQQYLPLAKSLHKVPAV